MEENFQQKIEERLAELPPQVQEAIASSDFEERVRTICRAKNLHVDQMQAVADETTLAMLGFIDMDSLGSGLQEHARLTGEQAQAVAGAIAQEVFAPIREYMKKWAEDRARPHQAAQTAPSAITAPMQASSVMMPSSAPKPAAPPAVSPTPAIIPSASSSFAPKPAQTAVSAPAPAAAAPDLSAADAMLSEKKVTPPAPAASAAPAQSPAASAATQADPTQPQPYKADPYREPVA